MNSFKSLPLWINECQKNSVNFGDDTPHILIGILVYFFIFNAIYFLNIIQFSCVLKFIFFGFTNLFLGNKCDLQSSSERVKTECAQVIIFLNLYINLINNFIY